MGKPQGSWWVDGYNVVLRLGMGAQSSLEERRAELVHRAASLSQQCWIVFDSREGGASTVARRVGTSRRTLTSAPPGESSRIASSSVASFARPTRLRSTMSSVSSPSHV